MTTSFRLLFTIANFAAVCGVLYLVAPAAGKEPPGATVVDPALKAGADSQAVWRAERLCATNSLYFLLRCANKSPEYQDLRDELLREDHASLYDIKNAAAKYALDLRIVRLTPAELRGVQVPVIAHFEIVALDGRVGGHFVVVTRAAHESIEYFDGSTGEPFEVPWREFERRWSGFAAVNAGRWGTWLSPLATYFAVSLCVTLLAVGVVRRFYRDSPIRSPQLK